MKAHFQTEENFDEALKSLNTLLNPVTVRLIDASMVIILNMQIQEPLQAIFADERSHITDETVRVYCCFA